MKYEKVLPYTRRIRHGCARLKPKVMLRRMSLQVFHISLLIRQNTDTITTTTATTDVADVYWQAFSEAVEESVRSIQVQDMNLRNNIRRLNRAMISAAAKHVGKSKPGRKTKPWSTPALRDAIKQRNTQTNGAVKPSGISGGVW